MASEETQIKNVLTDLTSDGVFRLDRMAYDEKSFGNVIVELESDVGIRIQCVRDRGQAWCSISSTEHQEEYFYLDDVMTAIGIPMELPIKDITETLCESIDIIKRNLTRITDAFSADRYPETSRRIAELKKRRAAELFQIYDDNDE